MVQTATTKARSRAEALADAAEIYARETTGAARKAYANYSGGKFIGTEESVIQEHKFATYQALLYLPSPAAFAIQDPVTAIEAGLWEQSVDRPGHLAVFTSALMDYQGDAGKKWSGVGVCHKTFTEDSQDNQEWTCYGHTVRNGDKDPKHHVWDKVDVAITAIAVAADALNTQDVCKIDNDDTWFTSYAKPMTEEDVSKMNKAKEPAIIKLRATDDGLKKFTTKAQHKKLGKFPHHIHSLTIYSDEADAIRKIRDYHETPIGVRQHQRAHAPDIATINDLLGRFVSRGIKVTIQWLPQNAGIEGSELAAWLANLGIDYTYEAVATKFWVHVGEYHGLLYSREQAKQDEKYWSDHLKGTSELKMGTTNESTKKSSVKKGIKKSSTEAKITKKSSIITTTRSGRAVKRVDRF